MDKNNLILGRKMVSIVTSVLILINVFVFVAGYFWGYRRASYDLQTSLNQTNFVDRINFNLGAINSDVINPNVENVIIASADLSQETEKPELIQSLATESEVNKLEVNKDDSFKYHAELIGFGLLKSAQNFVDKMKQKGYPVTIKKRISKRGNGKTVNWYQAVTTDFDNLNQLNQLVDTIKKIEHLQDIKIKRS